MTVEKEMLLLEPVFRFFNEISQIPRQSLHEEKISAYLFEWALKQGFEVKQDEAKNVFIRKPASPGYEDAPCIMLQAHIDMVCEKAPDVGHDFNEDPIQWKIDGDRISTGGRTTLGADNGIGVAYAMAVLTDEELLHPELEVLFTTAEEEDFSGVDGFDIHQMRAERLINLDHAAETEILCGSCGGMQVDLNIPVISEPVPAGFTAYKLNVSGLKGGHSGEDIHRGHGNAITLLARILAELAEHFEILLGPIVGGSFRLAIPRDAEAVVCFSVSDISEMETCVRKLNGIFARELSATGENLCVVFEPTDVPDWCVSPDKVLTTAFLVPDGIYQMNESLTGLVDTSDNMGEFYLEEKELHIITEIRAALSTSGEYLYKRMCKLAKLLGGTCESSNAYPSWVFQQKSEFRATAGKYMRSSLAAVQNI